jgi:hypothetical protein
MNVTITDNTDNTFVTIFPTGETPTEASNLNALVGKQEPTPNLVTTELSADGKFSVYNLNGTVNVIADVAGYYEDHNHDDRYFTEDEVTAMFDELRAEVVEGRMFVTTEADGTVRAGTVGIDVTRNGTGDYTLTIDAGTLPDGVSLDDCAINATADQPTGSTLLDVDVELLRIDGSTVDVSTDVLGVATDSGVSVTIVCGEAGAEIT